MTRATVRDMLAGGTPLLFDGAMGTEIQKLGFGTAESEGHPECNEIFNITRPDAIAGLHARYFDAGAMIVETNTIGGNRIKLDHFGFGPRAYEINLCAARAARQAAESCGGKLVCGAIGSTGHVPHGRAGEAQVSFVELRDVFEEQARGLLDGGVDAVLLETQQLLTEIRAAVIGVRRAMAATGRAVPLMVQGTFDEFGRMLLGADVDGFLGAVGNLGADVLGMNCSTGPAEMKPTVEALLVRSPVPVSMQPNAGMPENVDGRPVYHMGPEEFTRHVVPLITEGGVAVVGGCCGTTPEHTRALSEALKGKRCGSHEYRRTFCCCGSGIWGTDLEAHEAPVIIGERLNAQGSRKTKELLLADNWPELNDLGQEQVKQHSVLLDLCVAVNERDTEAQSMKALVGYLAERVHAGFCIDTTEPAVLEQALAVSPGSVLINSINLEHDCARARAVLELAREYGCPVIGLTIDDEGMARTAERKVVLAHRLADLACGTFGLPPHWLYVDPLVFTLATGERESADAAVCSLEALRRIRDELPGVRTAMGVSNVSFGLRPAARRVLNNLMLRHATEAGLRAAIYNPAHVDDVESYERHVRQLGEDLLFDHRPDALARFVEHFEQQQAPTAPKSAAGARKDERTPVQRLHDAVLGRDSRGLRETVESALATQGPNELLTGVLMPAMAEVGELMAAGKMILPFVLQAAEVMKEAVAALEPHLAHEDRVSRGTIVLATVYGDVHDIGKNLVGSILRNQGYEIVDLGRQVPAELIVRTVKERAPVAVGLSALLVTTSREMIDIVKRLDTEGVAVPVLVGGAAVNRAFAERIAVLEGNRTYAGGVHYCRDAFAATRVLEGGGAGSVATADARPAAKTGIATPVGSYEFVEPAERVEPPFYGTGQVLRWDSSVLLDSLKPEELYKGYWRGGSLGVEEYGKAVEEQFAPALERARREVLSDGLIDARVLYAYFPVIAEGESLVLLDPGDFHTERAVFTLPRVARKGNRSIVDYFRAEGDLVAVQMVTLGDAISARVRALLQETGEYSYGFYLNGLANQLTEDLADRVTKEITRGLGLADGRGKRFSFGYAGLPGLEHQQVLFELLAVDERLGVHLTEGYQMEPEHSTMGIYVHHPRAEYM